MSGRDIGQIYPVGKLIYTTNPIELLITKRRIKHKGSFSTIELALKILCLST